MDELELPSELRTLEFGSTFDRGLEEVHLPQSLECLTFGRDFDQSMDHARAPTHLPYSSFFVACSRTARMVTASVP